MTIEEAAVGWLNQILDVPVYAEVPAVMPERFVVLEKTGGARANYIWSATLAVQSWDRTSLLGAITLSDAVKEAMFDMAGGISMIGGVRLNSEYNWTDPESKYYRYQAVFDVTHYR